MMNIMQGFTLTIARQPQRRERFPRLEPYRRCTCGRCRECEDNERWDRIFARFEVKKYWEERGMFQSTLRGM